MNGERMGECMNGLVSWLVTIGWFVGCLVSWLFGWLVGCLVS